MNEITTKTESAPPPQKSALIAMANRLAVEPQKLIQTLSQTVFRGANEAEMMALCIVSNEYRLNPFLKQIYAYPKRGGGIEPLVSIDGWISIVNSHPQHDGTQFVNEAGPDGKPVAVTCRLFRKDKSHPIEVTEYYAECYRPTEPWKAMPHRMLRHKALMQCARIAFGVAGIHDEDECRDIEAREIEERGGGRRERDAVPHELPPPAEMASNEQLEEIKVLSEELGYDATRLAGGCRWASQQRAETPAMLEAAQAEKLLAQMRKSAQAAAAKGKGGEA